MGIVIELYFVDVLEIKWANLSIPHRTLPTKYYLNWASAKLNPRPCSLSPALTRISLAEHSWESVCSWLECGFDKNEGRRRRKGNVSLAEVRAQVPLFFKTGPQRSFLNVFSWWQQPEFPRMLCGWPGLTLALYESLRRFGRPNCFMEIKSALPAETWITRLQHRARSVSPPPPRTTGYWKRLLQWSH